MEIIKYVVGRLGRALISLFLVLVIVFLLMRMLPVDTYFGDRVDKMNDTTKQAILHDLGLDQPLYIQLWNYLKDLAHLDFGKSITYYAGKPVWSVIAPKIMPSFRFGAITLVISLTLGIALGLLMVRRNGKAADAIGNAYIMFIEAMPSMVIYLFIQFLGTKVLNIGMLYKEDQLITYVLPVISMSLGGIASNAMWMRRYMMDQINSDYVKLARAKGLSDKQIMRKHVLRNAFAPMAQNLPTSIIFTISGSLYIESLYSIPGTGGLLVKAIQAQDNPLVQTLVLFYAVLSVVGMLLGDLAMMVCDPRITLTKKGGSR
ncbi:MAG: ABC transporter permease [Christensenellales bacterium]